MKKSNLRKPDCTQALAEFWDSHDLTDFKHELKAVAEPVFVRGTVIKLQLASHEAAAIQKLARAKGVSREELIRTWVREKLNRRNSARSAKHRL
jgi:predicted DNA binding CopG/RHH family protein